LKLREALTLVSRQLEGQTAVLEAQVLLADLLDRSRTWVLAHPDAELTQSQRDSLDQALSRLLAGEPFPYVLGHWEFYRLEFTLSPQVLIPRPETELLVERAISWLQAHPGNRSMLELGTGSGCIAVAVAKHVRDVKILASDISSQALMVARGNARKQDVADRIEFLQADLLSAFPRTALPDRKFSLICSNPPYIPTRTLHDLQVFDREPTQALDGGPGGLAVISRLIREAEIWLEEPGLLLVEIDSSLSDTVGSIARAHFTVEDVKILKDLAGHDRVLNVER
jgi:release factor glutamine methyltransferase